MVQTTYIDATIEVLRRTLKMMFKIEATPTHHKQEESQISPFEISGVIGVTGPVTGCIVVSFPEHFAREMAARTFDGDTKVVLSDISEDEIIDCVGEVANVVGGNLLPVLGDSPGELRLSLPSVVLGTHRVVWRRKDTPYELVLFETELGEFGVGINMRRDEDEFMDTSVSNKSFKFLLVDDSRVTRRLLKNALIEADIGSCQFFEAAHGQEALDELERIQYQVDAVFCDLNMPVMDGMEFLNTLGTRGKLQTCPVIMVTGDLSEGRGVQTLAHGARDLIGKPFTPETIRESVKNVLGAV